MIYYNKCTLLLLLLTAQTIDDDLVRCWMGSLASQFILKGWRVGVDNDSMGTGYVG